jgi:hypothetical protein
MRDERSKEERPFAVTWEYPIRRVNKEESVTDGGSQVIKFLDTIADKRRRYVLYTLQNEGDSKFEDVIEQIAAWETGTPPEGLDERTKRGVRISLHHTHLPKLEDAGAIRYDRRTGSLSLRRLPDPLKTFLDYYAKVDEPESNE